ncbi:MAG: hypothetical protein ACE5F7_01365 [Nitrospiria bacterium]
MKNQTFPAYGEPIIDNLLADYAQGNHAARTYLDVSLRQGWPLVIDHVALRCLDIERRAAVFLKQGYVFEDEIVEYPDQGWWAKVYRKPGLPALFIDQAYDGARGKQSIIPAWVQRFGDEHLHHAAVLVAEIECAMAVMKERGIVFSGDIVGSPGSRLRQIFTASEVREDAPYTVLELTERNHYSGFYPDQANRLMQSSTRKAPK